MPETHKVLYAASCNPPRRAKRALVSSVEQTSSAPQVTSNEPRAIFPMRPYAPRTATTASDAQAVPPPPAKRGRKPGPLSRTAREAQRRLNHSIIEKARRTKINDALASLKQLVPANYGQQKASAVDSRDDEDEEDDDDYEEGSKKDKSATKGKGKKDEKEKEFKLEILVRTVSFLQDLLQRVTVLEADALPLSPCANCAGGKASKKRKRTHMDSDDDNRAGQDAQDANRPPRSAKIARQTENTPPPPSDSANVQSNTDIAPVPTDAAAAARLPSISSWLPNSVIDPQLLPAAQTHPANSTTTTSTATSKQRSSPQMGSYLPSPPASTHFDPVRTTQVPPLLNLGPVATAAMVSTSSTSGTSTSTRTPEDESAATLLLQISASSPTFRPVRSHSISTYSLPDPSNFSLHLHHDARSNAQSQIRQAQTPGSLLGLNVNMISNKKYQ
ncbi:hypothetical protein BDZ97DRAFT_1668966 [Flammula alnicola]|nr:hypothetical protein BDZ97DRAFT_1668966 [Flammula alnicola]